MANWIPLAVIAATVIVAIVALGPAASLRFGIWGRRLTAGLVGVCVVMLTSPTLIGPIHSPEAKAITCLRAIHAGQLLYQTSLGEGRYARTLDELEKNRPSSDAQQGPTIRLSLPQSYRIELVSTGDSYAVTATPLPNPRSGLRGSRAFCVDVNGSLFQTPSGARPAVDRGGCRDRSKPLQ